MTLLKNKIRIYRLSSGEQPFYNWLNGIKDEKNRSRVKVRLKRLVCGNFGDCKALGNSIYELRLQFGPGYRVYFGKVRRHLVLLLCGGDKSSQKRDIEKANTYWLDTKGENYGNSTKY